MKDSPATKAVGVATMAAMATGRAATKVNLEVKAEGSPSIMDQTIQCHRAVDDGLPPALFAEDRFDPRITLINGVQST